MSLERSMADRVKIRAVHKKTAERKGVPPDNARIGGACFAALHNGKIHRFKRQFSMASRNFFRSNPPGSMPLHYEADGDRDSPTSS